MCPHCGAPYIRYDKSTGQRSDTSALRVTIRDLDLPFPSLLALGLKILLAFLPAILIFAALIGAAVGIALHDNGIGALPALKIPGQ